MAKEFQDLGFGTQLVGSRTRLVNKDGSFNITRKGQPLRSIYLNLVNMSWLRFFGIITIFYFLINLLFALLYWFLAGTESIRGIEKGTRTEEILEFFFFSIQTFTTVGYGAMSPEGTLANLLAAIGALVGLLSFALATGLLFARFSKPLSHVVFSEKGIIAPYQEGKSLQIRIVNSRNSNVIDLEARITMTWLETAADGVKKRAYAPLMLERDKVFMFPLNWTIVHPITKGSPLYGLTPEDLEKKSAEFLVLIQGHDESFSMTIHKNTSYTWDELEWNTRFKPMYFPNEEGGTDLYVDRLSDTVG